MSTRTEATPRQLAEALRHGSPNGRVSAGEGVPPFPAVFPPVLTAYVTEAAAAFDIPTDFVSAPLLAYGGAALGNRLTISPKEGWEERPTIWVAVVGAPGTGKSPGDEAARDPLEAMQAAARVRYWEEKKQYDRECRAAKAAPGPLFAPSPEPPRLESLFTTDATLEAVAAMLEATPGLALAREEVLGWVLSFDAYRQGGDRQTWLSLWAGRFLKVDRKTAG
jgi:hypothetical protein